MKNFKDYYRILEVHYDARPEIIQAAYKRLIRIYHPDNGYKDTSYMNQLNEAYAVLHDTKKRCAYHLEWMKHYAHHHHFTKKSCPLGQGDASIHAAKNAIETFFYAQQYGKSDQAYLLLTQEDQKRTTLEDFSLWRNLVTQCYKMQEVNIRYLSIYKNCRIDTVCYPLVAEFAVTITDMDTMTLKISSETLQKYTAFDGVSWKVCLGVRSLKKSIVTFELLSEKRKKQNNA